MQLSSVFLTEVFQSSFIALAETEDERRKETIEYSKDPLFTLKPDMLDIHIDELFEEYLDKVFGNNSRPDKDDFINSLSNENASFLLPCFYRSWLV